MNTHPIFRFLTGVFTLTRRPEPTISGGLPVAQAPTVTTITASIQPARGPDLKAIPQGLWTDDMRVLFTESILQTAGSGYMPDEITIDGRQYYVVNVERWTHHTRAILARKGKSA